MSAQVLSHRQTTVPIRSLHGAAAAASLATLAAIGLLALTAPDAVTAAGPVLLAIGVLIGLPHGAVDHLVPAWTGRAMISRLGMAGVVAGYVGAALIAWAALTFGGPWALPALMLLSIGHFGLGDVITGAERDEHSAPRGLELWCAVFARGGPVLILPLVFWAAPLDAALNAFDPRVTELLSTAVRLTLLGLLVVCCVVTIMRDHAAGRRLQVAELMALWVLFTVTPPLAAFGVYFGFWHSLRHVVRLLLADPRNAVDLSRGLWRDPLRRYARAAGIPTVGSLLGIVALVSVANATPLLVPMLSVLMALTVPHVVFVAMLDAASRTRVRAEGQQVAPVERVPDGLVQLRAAEPLPATTRRRAGAS